MNREDIIRLAIEHTIHGLKFDEDGLVRFANLVAEYERTKLQGQIETLYAMYELASKQRDYLMEQQNAQVAAMRGKMQ
jgi:hypothetical protein